jgi:hypothetical protein
MEALESEVAHLKTRLEVAESRANENEKRCWM